MIQLYFTFMQRLPFPQGMAMDWQGTLGNSNSYLVKKIMRLDIPVDAYPNVCCRCII